MGARGKKILGVWGRFSWGFVPKHQGMEDLGFGESSTEVPASRLAVAIYAF